MSKMGEELEKRLIEELSEALKKAVDMYERNGTWDFVCKFGVELGSFKRVIAKIEGVK